MPTIKSQEWMALDFYQYGDARLDEYWIKFLTLFHECPHMAEKIKRDGLELQMRKMGSSIIIQARLAEYLRLDDDQRRLSILADIMDDACEQKRVLGSLRDLPTDAPVYLRISDAVPEDDTFGRGRASAVTDPPAGAVKHDNGKGSKKGGKAKGKGGYQKGKRKLPQRAREEIDNDPKSKPCIRFSKYLHAGGDPSVKSRVFTHIGTNARME